jgi:hypothetical protein
VGDIDLPGPPQDVGAGDDEAAFAHLLAVDEGRGVTGDGTKISVASLKPYCEWCLATRFEGYGRENQPQRSAEQVEPQIASGGRDRGACIPAIFRPAMNMPKF